MKLETADREYESIDEYTVAEAVKDAVDIKTRYAVLVLDDGSFMQVSSGTAGTVLEYQDNQTGGHFTTQPLQISAEDAAAIVESFAASDDNYKTAVDWQPVEEKQALGCGSAALLLTAFPAIVYLLS